MRVFNDRGSLLLKAKVDGVVQAGVARSPSTRWLKRASDGRNANALTSDRLTDMGGGPTFYSCLVCKSSDAATDAGRVAFVDRARGGGLQAKCAAHTWRRSCLSVVSMDDPHADAQLVDGFYSLEGNTVALDGALSSAWSCGRRREQPSSERAWN